MDTHDCTGLSQLEERINKTYEVCLKIKKTCVGNNLLKFQSKTTWFSLQTNPSCALYTFPFNSGTLLYTAGRILLGCRSASSLRSSKRLPRIHNAPSHEEPLELEENSHRARSGE